jgi:putative DNA primase/helicase
MSAATPNNNGAAAAASPLAAVTSPAAVQTAALFLRELYGGAPPGFRTVCFSDPAEADPKTGKGPLYTNWHRAADPDAAAADAVRLCNRFHVWHGVGLAAAKKSGGGRIAAKDVIAIPGVWCDVDWKHRVHKKAESLPPTPAAARELIAKFPLPPTWIIRTGHGWQAYWQFRALWVFDGDAGRGEAQRFLGRFKGTINYHAAAMGWKVDAVADLARLLRLPGTLNIKDPAEPAPVELAEHNPDARYTPDDFECFLLSDGDEAQAPAAASAKANGAKVKTNDLSEYDLLGKMFGASNGAAIRRLYDGDDGSHGGDASAADQALVNHLAFWAGGDRDRIDKLFRGSGRMRPKWDDRHAADGRTYGQLTIDTALKSVRNFYDPHHNGNGSHKGNGNAGGSGAAVPAADVCPWVDPKPLPPELPPVAPFNDALLPESLRPWIVDIASRVQCPPDFPAVSAMVSLSGVVGRKVGIRPKRRDDWLVVPNVWGAVIGRPSIMKSPACAEPLKPLKRLEIAAKQAYEEALRDYEAKAMVAKAEKKVREGKVKEAVKKGGDAVAVAREGQKDPREPVRKRYIVNDSTVEKLGELLNQNPNGLLCYRDELIGLLKSLDKEGQEGARSFYLEAWNGTNRYTFDRIGRGTLDIESTTLSVIGCIQPGPLSDYLRAAASGGAGDDGLVQRYQLAVWPDVSREWRNFDHYPDTAAKAQAYEVFTRLDALSPADVGAIIDPNDPDPDAIPYLRFSGAAQELFDEWRAGLERKIRGGDEHPAIESHLSKYRSLVPSLALLIYLAEGGTAGAVDEHSLVRAIAWADYLETHARRIYADAVSPALSSAKALARKLIAGELPDGFGRKDVYRPGWSRLKTAEDATRAVDYLEGLGWLRETVEQTAGAPRTRYWINPAVIRQAEKTQDPPAQGTARTAESPAGTLTAVPAVAAAGGAEDLEGSAAGAEREEVEFI